MRRNDVETLILACEFAIQDRLTLVDSYRDCHAAEDEAIKAQGRKAILRFKDIQARLLKLRPRKDKK